MFEISPNIGLGFSTASSAQSGGPFTNNSEIVFGDGIFGQTSQNESQSATPTATTAIPISSSNPVANPYAPNAAVGSAGTASSLLQSPVVIFGALAVGALLVIWYINR